MKSLYRINAMPDPEDMPFPRCFADELKNVLCLLATRHGDDGRVEVDDQRVRFLANRLGRSRELVLTGLIVLRRIGAIEYLGEIARREVAEL